MINLSNGALSAREECSFAVRLWNKLRASLLWLVEGDAITLAQADRLDDIYAHRHDLSHELIKYVVNPDFEPDVEPLTDALKILKSIRRLWTSIEKGIG